MSQALGERFLATQRENPELNQYWYSKNTIHVIADEVVQHATRCAFLSTPSIYFSLPHHVRARCKLFDIDRKWEADPGFVYFDFRQPELLPSELAQSFDMVVIDPPFITREVWEAYAATAKFLLVREAVDDEAESGDQDGASTPATPKPKVLCTTIIENAALLQRLLGVTPQRFLPSVPNLIYQYNIFTNYPSPKLEIDNPELPSC